MPKVLPGYLEQRRRQILDAAAACFARAGFHQTSMQDICECAELSPGAIYRYFKGKEDIIAAICDDQHERDLAVIEGIKAHGGASEVMEELGRAFLHDSIGDDIRLHIDLLAEAPRSEHIRTNVRAGSDAIVASFADFVRRSQDSGDMNPALDAEAIAQVMCALYHGFVVLKQINPEVEAHRYFEAVMAIFNGGLFGPGVAESTRLDRVT